MASPASPLLLPRPSPHSRRAAPLFPILLARLPSFRPLRSRPPRGVVAAAVAATTSPPSPLHALIFDCDGVILESEHLHRQAYNEAFAHFGLRSPSAEPLYWSSDFYDVLQNRIGGGKPKMRWYFGEKGWPESKIFEKPPSSDADKEKLIDILQ